MTTAASIQSTLRSTLEELDIRSQVEATLRDVIRDVELAQHWTDYLQRSARLSRLQEHAAEYEKILDETRAITKDREQRQVELADRLVQELWSLSQMLGELQAMKTDHEKLLKEHNRVASRLAEKESELEDSRRTAAMKGNNNTSSIDLATQQTGGYLQERQITRDYSETDKQTVSSPGETDTSRLPNPAETESKEAPLIAPTVDVLPDQSNEDNPTPHLDELDNKIILHIFAYLDAYDILNTAQVNISMYSRVDTLFGFGQEEAAEGEGNHEAEISIEHDRTNQEPSEFNKVPTADQSVSHTQQTTSQSAAAATVPSAAITMPPTSVKAPSTSNLTTAPRDAASGSSSFVSTISAPVISSAATAAGIGTAAATAATSVDGPLGLGIISSILQPRTKPSTASSPAKGRRAGETTSSSQREAAAMTPSMANAIAAKLSDKELNAIILMTERLKHKEALAERLTRENETLVAKLAGTDAVKQFLVVRVREMEQALATLKEEDAMVAQQIASDQEVIAYLDGRVQELEMKINHTSDEKMELAQELARVKEQAEQKFVVMGDMLQYEREKLSESEREWKAAKKLLIKEVKGCRAQIVALQAERDGHREQFERLRNAVLTSSTATTVADSLSRNSSWSRSSRVWS